MSTYTTGGLHTVRRIVFILYAAMWITGCTTLTSLHYGWAYTPMHDAKGSEFQPPTGKIEYRELDNVEAMVEAERDMYRKGYVMIGYSNMISPQLELVAPSGARNLGKKHGASVVLNTFQDNHFLATLWALPKQFVFGAYFSDDLPDDARAALKGVLKNDHGVIVQTVVEDSPAFHARVRPGDLLLAVNEERIRDAAAMSKLLRQHAGSEITLMLWSMTDGAPRPISVALNRHL